MSLNLLLESVCGTDHNSCKLRLALGPLNHDFAKDSQSFLVGVDLSQDGRKKPLRYSPWKGKVSLLV